jgi:hypothetical protein
MAITGPINPTEIAVTSQVESFFLSEGGEFIVEDPILKFLSSKVSRETKHTLI